MCRGRGRIGASGLIGTADKLLSLSRCAGRIRDRHPNGWPSVPKTQGYVRPPCGGAPYLSKNCRVHDTRFNTCLKFWHVRTANLWRFDRPKEHDSGRRLFSGFESTRTADSRHCFPPEARQRPSKWSRTCRSAVAHRRPHLAGDLEEKGHLKHRKDGKTYVYRPCPRTHAGWAVCVRRVLQTFFSGSLEQAVAAHLADKEPNLRPDELQRMVSLIRQARKEGR